MNRCVLPKQRAIIVNRNRLRVFVTLLITGMLLVGQSGVGLAGVIDDLKMDRAEIELELENFKPHPVLLFLGQRLFHDKILSGNKNISCATCHHAFLQTGDGLSLSIGEGGRGLGMTRDTGAGDSAVVHRVPRNAPPLWNVGLTFVDRWPVMFWDGRVENNPQDPTGFTSPAGADLPYGLDNVLEVQTLFPVQSADEMAGQQNENSIADAAVQGQLTGMDGVWNLLVERLRADQDYVTIFKAAFPGEVESPDDISYVLVAKAIAAFEAVFGSALDSPFDRYLLGDDEAMSAKALKGMELFYGDAGCSSCHQGVLQTDFSFHNIGMPQIGPGKGDGPSGLDDFGRERVTGLQTDRYKFRTPSLRMVEVNGPWGHAGAYNSLEDVIRHHTYPLVALDHYDPDQAVLPSRSDLNAIDFTLISTTEWKNQVLASVDIQPKFLVDKEIDLLMAFLSSLTDHSSLNLHRFVPTRLPSGLPVVD